MKIVDSHLHLDIIADEVIFDFARQNLRAAIIWSFCETKPETFADLTAYFMRQQTFTQNCTAQGLPCFRLAGIHPRNIPIAETVTQAKIDTLLEPQLNDAKGIGEIGLETGSDIEKTVLAMQLNFAKRHKLKVGIHTPRKNKHVIIPPTLEIIEQSGIAPDLVLIDHLDSAPLVWTVVNMGYHAGITISPAKSKLSDVMEILAQNEDKLDRIMLNSDLALPKIDDYKMYIDSIKALPPLYENTGGQTAINFFNVKM